MTHSNFLSAAVVLLLLAGVQNAISFPCSETNQFLRTFSNHSQAHLVNTSFTVTAINYETAPKSLGTATFGLYGFQEATRDAQVKCIEADEFPGISEKWAATLFKSVRISDMECEVVETIETVPGTDVQIKTLQFTATIDLYPDLVMNYNLSTASKAGNYTFTYPVERVAEYETDESFKFTVAVNNWPWTNSTNSSYLVSVFWANLQSAAAGDITMYESNDKWVTEVTSVDGLKMTQSMDQTFWLDGVKYIHEFPATVFPPVAIDANSTWTKTISWAFCNYLPPMYQYKQAFYDPSLALLFNLGDESADKSAPKSKTARATWIAAIVVPVVVILVVAAIVVFFVLKPEVNPLKKMRGSSLGDG